MFLSLNWLKDFVDIPKKITPEELGLRLTMHTVEIDSVVKQADKYKKVVVGKIAEIKKHPNADKLQIVRVKIKTEDLEIVCAALNIKPGLMVPVALVGAVLPNGLEIKETEIRGIKSNGMLCAEDELGLGEDHSGIMILAQTAKIGQNFSDYLKIEDVIFEVDNKSITNRPDLWSHYGMAREISAFLGLPMKTDKIPLAPFAMGGSVDANVKVAVKVEDFKLCPRYMAIAMAGLKIAPSPKWLQDRLIAVGIRPISNIVDITNFVMMELGQPLHAFDLMRINTNLKTNLQEARIIIRRAGKEEAMETLDGTKRRLDDDILVIANEDKPIAIAGVMGGAESEIDNSTTSVVFESANFDFVSIRKTSQKLGLRTEASIRYEKSLDPNLCEAALARAVALVKEICPGSRVSSQLADEKSFNLEQGPIDLDLNWLNLFVGEKLKEKKVMEILVSLGFSAVTEGKILKINIPSWRATKDISIKEDIAEEVARVYGYDNLISVMPKVEMKAPLNLPERILEKKIKNILSSASGLSEVYNYSYVGANQLKKLGLDAGSHIHLANPISKEQTMLRENLAVNLIGNVKLNQARFEKIKIFEIGNVFIGGMSGEEEKVSATEEKLPYQEKKLGIAMAAAGADIFSEIKSLMANLFAFFELPVTFNVIEAFPNWADKNESAKIVVGKLMIGTIYKLSAKVGQSAGVKKPCVISEISLKELLKILGVEKVNEYSAYEKFPPVIRDMAFVVNERILYNDIKAEIANWHPFIKTVELFDVYFGEKIGVNKKNMAFSIIYQTDKTLTAAEVDEIQAGLIKRMEEKFEAKIRDF